MEQQTQESIEIILAQIYGLAQVINNLSIQVNNQINNQINSQNNSQINNQINSQINNQINSQINNQVNNQVNNQINSQVNNQNNNQINSQNNNNNQVNSQNNNNNQVNSQNNNQDYSPDLFSKKDMEMNILDDEPYGQPIKDSENNTSKTYTSDCGDLMTPINPYETYITSDNQVPVQISDYRPSKKKQMNYHNQLKPLTYDSASAEKEDYVTVPVIAFPTPVCGNIIAILLSGVF